MKILHLEDNRLDAELIGNLIAEEWSDSEIAVISRRSDFVAELQGGAQDLIISDFSMGSFNGLEALDLARRLSPDTPFIFVSGTLGEDRAIAALHAGAADYVIKDRLKRLVPAIHKALHGSEERKAKRQLEEQLLRVQRTENIGLLAAGVAHDLNNVLAPILMGSSMLRDKARDPADIKLLQLIEKSAERGASLVRQILAFAHGASGERQLASVELLTREVITFISEAFPKTIRFEYRVPRNLWPVTANSTQIHQVLLNLCINARDAMVGGGVLSLSAENEHLDEAKALAIPEGRPGAYLVFEVKDTGAGIPPEVLIRMWEPFFTTKPAGQGTGLGLSTVRGIVENHGGFIAVQTAAGEGTRFRIYLPAAGLSPVSDAAKPARALKRGGGELILVVDDEKDVRDMAVAILSTNGYRVVAAGDGAEGMALFSKHVAQISLVISDMQMPNFNGAVLARVIRRVDPKVKILAMSGISPGTEPGVAEEPVNFGQAFIKKPFTAEILLDQAHTLIHSGS